MVTIRNNWNVDQVYYHDPGGRLRSIPITWTSLIAADPAVEFGKGQTPFKLVDLLELARLIDTLKEQQQVQAPQAELKATDIGEGQDV